MEEARGAKSLRLSEAGIKAVQRVADAEGVSWNEAARRLLKWATSGQPKPKGWH
jgi:hypothetical protein